MLKELGKGEIRITWGTMPHENWCGGIFGGNRDEGDRSRYYEYFKEELEDVITAIQPFHEIPFEEWLERIESLCVHLRLDIMEDEYWPEADKEDLFSEEELYIYADEEDVKNNPEEYEYWDEDEEGKKFYEPSDDALPWFGIVDQVMDQQQYKILIEELRRLLKVTQDGGSIDWEF